LSQQLGHSPEERPTPLVSYPSPIDASERLIFVASESSRKMRLRESIYAAVTPRRVVISLALALVALLIARGIESRISEIIIHLGR